MIGLSLTGLCKERDELQKDLAAFKAAHDSVRRRLLEVSETDPHRMQALERWAGTWASLGSLELAVAALERQVSEVDHHVQQVMAGEIKNTDPQELKKSFGVIDGGIE